MGGATGGLMGGGGGQRWGPLVAGPRPYGLNDVQGWGLAGEPPFTP